MKNKSVLLVVPFALPIIINAAFYSSCPNVSIGVAFEFASSNRVSNCDGNLLRIKGKGRISGIPDANGRKYYSPRKSLYLYEHKFGGGQRFVSIRLGRDPRLALSEENGGLRFKKTNTSATPPDEFLFNRVFLGRRRYEGFRTKSSKRFIIFSDQKGCRVSLLEGSSIKQLGLKTHRFVVKCKPMKNRCYCFPNKKVVY